MLNLNKILDKGSLRWIGENFDSFLPPKTIIAGNSIKDISIESGFKAFQLGRCNPKNVFLIYDENDIFYIYVSPRYRNYRNIFKSVISAIPNGYHVDHVLSKSLAIYFNYQYVLLCMIPDRVNVKHGHYEKRRFNFPNGFTVPKTCLSDDRIYDKILSRNPHARKAKKLIDIYSPLAIPGHGLTLKQRGIWNSAFGFDKVKKADLISKLQLIS